MAHLSTTADLELSLRRWSGDDYALEARFQLGGSAALAQLISGAPPRIHLDFAALSALALTPDAYGATLGQAFFADPRVGEMLARARAQAESLSVPLRLRLRCAADDDAIHALRWETLQAPSSADPLARSERILFSRHLDSADMTPLQIGPRAALRALVAVAGPPAAELARYNLAAVDVPAELARAQAAIGDLPASVIASGQGPGASFDALVAALRDGPEIVILVAHGSLRRGRPYLWLDDGQGGAERVEGVELVEAIARLPKRPLLLLLLSCQSAGDDAGAALAGIGPQLAAAGVAAVIAMQGNLTMAGAARLLPAFFAELWRDGQVDRALAAARLALRGSPDWWRPALFLRVPDGRLWLADAPPAPAISAGPAIPPPPQPERPPEIPGFVGRAAELAALSAGLAREGMLLIAGMPGVGKTSMAAALARHVGDPATTFWYSFHPGEGAESLIWALAGFLAHAGRPGLWELLQSARLGGGLPPPLNVQIDYVVQLLEGAEGLLCLDDFQLVDEDPQIGPFITRLTPLLRAGRLRLIVTSRHVPDFALIEHVELLTGLGIGDAALLLSGRGVVLEEALLVDLYTQVGGNAQMLTLAADALRRASDPARLIGALTEADNIERYLLDEIDAALSNEERGTMKPIAALLDSGGTRGAIEALADGANVRRPLRSLSDRYLLLTQEAAAGKEYRQHAIVQRFYYAELGKRERVELHRRAAAYYESEEPEPLRAVLHYLRAGEPGRAAELAVRNVSTAINSGQARYLSGLLAQIRPEQLDPATWSAVCAAAGELAALFGDYDIARARLEQALVAGAALEASPVQVEAQARCRRLLALVGERTGSYDRAEADCRAGLALAQSLDTPHVEAARLHAQLGDILMRRGDFAASAQACQAGLEALPPEPAAPGERARLLQRLASIDGQRGIYAEAVRALERSLSWAERAGDKVLVAAILNNLGIYLSMMGRLDEALAKHRQSLDIKEHVGDLHGQVYSLGNIATIHFTRSDAAQNDLAAASDYLSKARRLCDRHQGTYSLENVLIMLGMLQYLQGTQPGAGPDDLAQAEMLLRQALAIAESLDDDFGRAGCLYRLGDVALAQGEPATAHTLADQTLTLARQLDSPAYCSCALRVIGEALLQQGRLPAAATSLDEAWQLQRQVQDPYDQTLTLAALARLRLAQGEHAAAQSFVDEGLALARTHQLNYQRDLLMRLRDQLADSRYVS